MSRKIMLGVLLCLMCMTMFVSADDTENVTVNVTVAPTITLSLSTSALNFGEVSPGTTAVANDAIVATVQSNVGYHLEVASSGNFLDASEVDAFAITNLGMKVDADVAYTQFAASHAAITASSDFTATSSRAHTLDFNLNVPWDEVPGDYHATIQIIAAQ